MGPYVAAGTSWVLAREFLGNFGQEKNGLWSYPVAVAAPATIWGIFKNSIESGLRFPGTFVPVPWLASLTPGLARWLGQDPPTGARAWPGRARWQGNDWLKHGLPPLSVTRHNITG